MYQHLQYVPFHVLILITEMHFYQHGMVAEIFEKIGTIILLLSDSVTQKKMEEKKMQCYCRAGFHKQGI